MSGRQQEIVKLLGNGARTLKKGGRRTLKSTHMRKKKSIEQVISSSLSIQE